MVQKLFFIFFLTVLPTSFAEARLSGMPIARGKSPTPLVKPAGAYARSEMSVLEFTGCTGACAREAGNILTPDQIQIVNRMDKTGDHAVVTSKVVSALPNIKSNLEIAGFPSTKTQQTIDSLLAAAYHHTAWKDPTASANLIQYANSLAGQRNPRDQMEKIEEVNKNCTRIAL